MTDPADGAAPQLREAVDEHLRALGAAPEDIERARADDELGLLAVALAAFPGERTYTPVEMGRMVGMPRELTNRFWRSLGFPDVPEDERWFNDDDLDVLRTVKALIDIGVTDVDVAVQMTRVVGSSMSRVAEAQLAAAMVRPRDREMAEMLALAAPTALDTFGRLLLYVWRRHLQAAARRALAGNGAAGRADRPVVDLVVGFADLVGFTALAQQVDDAELAHIVNRFESLAFDHVAAHGARITKMIGDEVMFVCDDPGAAVDLALGLSEAYADDELLSDVRVGLASGPVLAREGDYYGPVVNLASRIVNIAIPGSVLVSESVHAPLADDRRFHFSGLRPRSLKDIGRVRLWRVRRARDDGASAHAQGARGA